jgi:hypothetical protein
MSESHAIAKGLTSISTNEVSKMGMGRSPSNGTALGRAVMRMKHNRPAPREALSAAATWSFASQSAGPKLARPKLARFGHKVA